MMKKAFVVTLSLLMLCLFSGMRPGPESMRTGMSERPAGSVERYNDLCIVPSENPVEDEDSENETYKELEEELQGIMEELEKLEEDAREKLKDEVLPRIKREIQKLREKLRKLDLDEEQPKVRET
jgi:hypothetical protein